MVAGVTRCGATQKQIAEYTVLRNERRAAIRAWKLARQNLRDVSAQILAVQKRDGIDPSQFSAYATGRRGKTA